jgi:hypothetical protein
MLDVAQTQKFDDSNITWYTLDWLEHVSFYVYAVDEPNGIVDVIFKIAPNKQAMLHKHHAPYITLVLQGELRFHRPNGELKEVRPVGSYVVGVANGEPHTEGAGDEEAIVFFSNRNVTGDLYEFLDQDMNRVQMLGIADFRAQLDQQVASGTATKTAARPARSGALS